MMHSKDDKKNTLLIVDDHHVMRRTLRQWVSEVLPDFNIREVSSGEQAIAMVATCQPMIVLMDIHLPGINGIEATRQLKNASPVARVIVLTAHEDPRYHNAALQAGADAYIVKRQMYEMLINTIQDLDVSLGSADRGCVHFK